MLKKNSIKKIVALVCFIQLFGLLQFSALAATAQLPVPQPPSGDSGGGGMALSTVSFNANGAETGTVPSSLSGATGVIVTIPGNTGSLTKTGYVLTGWNTKADGSGDAYFAGSTLTMPSSSVILYAQWEKKEIVFIPGDWPIVDGNYNVAYSTSDGKGTIVPTSFYNEPAHAVLYKTPVAGTYAAKYNFIGFKDISDTYWAREFVWYLSARNVLNGTTKDTFEPEKSMTRAEFVKMLVCLTPGLDLASVTQEYYTDVKTGDWFAPYVNWAAANQIIDGYADGSFHPKTPIIREDMCRFIAKYASFIGYSLGTVNAPVTFTDQDQITPSALADVSALQQSGLIVGVGGKFVPQGVTSRAEAATIGCRFLMGILAAMDNPSAIPMT